MSDKAMNNLANPDKSLWMRLWQPFLNLPIYGKFALVLASFILGFLCTGLHSILCVRTVKAELIRTGVSQEFLGPVFSTLDAHMINGAVLIAVIMALLSLTSFLCIRMLVTFLDHMISTLRTLRNSDDTSRIAESSIIPIISGDMIGKVATLVNELTTDIRDISMFRRTIEADETVDEVYKRLAYVFKEKLGLSTFVIWEVKEQDDSIQAVYSWHPDLANETCVMSDANLCRAKRTGEIVNSSGYPNICPVFPLTDVMTHTCVPMLVGGKVLGVVQFLSLFVDTPERERALQINLNRASRYLKEAPACSTCQAPGIQPQGNSHQGSPDRPRQPQVPRKYHKKKKNLLIAGLKRRNSQLGILMCDLDFFKQVNDEHGHEAGDQILMNLARILLNNVRSSDIPIRFGGEEFLILLTDCEPDNVVKIAEKIRYAVESEPFQVKNITIRKTISIGASVFPNDTEAFWECVKFADIALYKAKETGRNKVLRFEPSMWASKEY